MTKVLHLIQSLSLGGASRAAIALAKYSTKLNPDLSHSITSLNPAHEDPNAVQLATSEGMTVLRPQNMEELRSLILHHDIVQINWWNCPEMSTLFQSGIPDSRLVVWAHVGGHQAPQMISRELCDFTDAMIACSPYTRDCPAMQSIGKDKITGVVYGAADFARLDGLAKRAHSGCNVGYIGTVHFLKMHPNYVKMSAAVRDPEIHFTVCGSGGAEEILKAQAKEIGAENRFNIRGYVEDIKSAIEGFDIYGYPLCEDTYAASEVNLQEVMYAGVPPVVFPYGGVQKLVVDNFTGLIVKSEREYSEAIEYLWKNPSERQRIGRNAKLYAEQIFGSENAAKEMNHVYSELMQSNKRSRKWGYSGNSLDNRFVGVRNLLWPNRELNGAELFIESLGNYTEDFLISFREQDISQVVEAELRISRKSELMKSGGVRPYARYFRNDPHLALWCGLLECAQGEVQSSIEWFVSALNNGLNTWRVMAYLAIAAERAGQTSLAESLRGNLQKIAAHIPAASQITL